jgi:hypothetical protein
MVGGCVVELNFTTYITCQVSAVSKILSMQSTEFCLCRLRTNLVQNFSRTAFWSEKLAPKKVTISFIFIKKTFHPKTLIVIRSASTCRTNSLDKFVQSKLTKTKIEICFPACMQLLVLDKNLVQ